MCLRINRNADNEFVHLEERMHRRSWARAAKAVLASVLVSMGAGCSTLPGDGDKPPAKQIGTIQLALQVNGVSLTSATYTVTGPNGYMLTGTAKGPGGTSVSAFIGGVPAGSGYSISLQGVAADGVTTCGGVSGTFSVAANGPTTVVVALLCREPRNMSGIAVTGNEADICPNIDGVSADATSASIGGTPVGLSATAHDADSGPMPLSYQWTAPSGTFSNAAIANPTFSCTAPGTVVLTLTVSDGYPDPTCPDTATISIVCTM
jgi:hypothetical protein